MPTNHHHPSSFRLHPLSSALLLFPILLVTPALADDPAPAFVDQLRQLPSLVDSGCPRHWAWGGRGGLDPANPAHVQYARVAGGVIAFAHKPAEVAPAARVAKKAGAHVRFGVRIHPFKGPFWRPKDGPAIPPTYLGPEVKQEMDGLRIILLLARRAALEEQVTISRVFVDSETFKRDSPEADDRTAWNEAMRQKHFDLVMVIHQAVPEAEIEFYNFSPVWKCTTLQEEVCAAGMSLYELNRPQLHQEHLARTIDFQYARQLDSTTAHIALGAGWVYESRQRKWDWEFDDDGTQARELAKVLMRFNNRSVHNVIDYTAFDDRAIHWPKHALIYFRALLEAAR